MNLFELAVQNSEALQAKYQDLTAQFEKYHLLPSLEAFVEQVKSHSRMSINMRQHDLNGLLLSERHKNIYEWAEARVKLPPNNREQILRERLKSYYEARMAFDHFFDDGENFRYGALNIGGLGATLYGEYCVILTRKFLDDCLYLAFIKEDSLKGYVLPGSSVDIARLTEEVADKEHAHILAALKHQGDIQTLPSEEWGGMVCRSDAYIEAITIQDIYISVVGCVRINKQEYRKHYDDLYKRYIGLTEPAQRLARNFRDVLKLLKNHKIKLEIIDED